MRVRTSWVAVGAAAVLGVAATTTAASALNDRGELSTTTGSIDLPGGSGTTAVDDSPGTADSPAQSVVESPAAAPAPTQVAPAPVAPAPAPPPAPRQAPAPAPVYVDDSADSPDVGGVQSAASAASADSP